MAVNFIGGGKQSTRRKPLIHLKSSKNFITYCNVVSSKPKRIISPLIVPRTCTNI